MVHPPAGVLTMDNLLSLNFGINVNQKRVRRLMRIMCIETIYPKKCHSRVGTVNYVKPYLKRHLDITHCNQGWSTDISYIPMPHGFMYLYAVIDVYSCYIVAWRISNSLSARNFIALVDECVATHGTPEIINSDQGIQYTCAEWEAILNILGIQIRMDGKSRCKDNIRIEHFWHTIKQEYIFINPQDDANYPQDGISCFIVYYNNGRPHQGNGYKLPSIRYAA